MEGHVKRCRKLTDEERDVYLRKHCGDIEDVGADEVTEDDDDDVVI